MKVPANFRNDKESVCFQSNQYGTVDYAMTNEQIIIEACS
jgi:hypothetical protein